MFTSRANCGYARTAVRELTLKKKGKYARSVNVETRRSEFEKHIALPDNLFVVDRTPTLTNTGTQT